MVLIIVLELFCSLSCLEALKKDFIRSYLVVKDVWVLLSRI